MAKKNRAFWWVILLLPFMGCTRHRSPEEIILVKVGDRSISKSEFISRAEYTPRPAYCRGDNYIHRKIVLNSLIAEKLLAMEVGEDNELERNEQFQLYLQGRKEQSMRQWLYYHDFYEPAHIDTAEIKNQYQLSGRTYKIAYLTVSESAAGQIQQWLTTNGGELKAAYRQLVGNDSIPRREVSWSGAEHPEIIKALFEKPLQVGQLIGPISIDEGQVIFIHILGWSDRPAMTESEQHKRWLDAKERLRVQKADAAFRTFVQKLMAGKTMHFHPQTFPRIVQTMGDFYLRPLEDKQAALNFHIWREDQDQAQPAASPAGLDEIAEEPFLSVDGQTWSVRDFQRALLRHPLVFRKSKMKKNEFAAELQKAIADLVQDHYITQEAYRRGYDKVNLIERNVNMWRDHLLAMFQRNLFLARQGAKLTDEKTYMTLLRNHLDPYVANLRQKYQNRIEINTDEFEKIKLTAIDMFVIQKNTPFPIVVPSFPMLTTHALLDYGHQLSPNGSK